MTTDNNYLGHALSFEEILKTIGNMADWLTGAGFSPVEIAFALGHAADKLVAAQRTKAENANSRYIIAVKAHEGYTIEDACHAAAKASAEYECEYKVYELIPVEVQP
jgi:hypothetical protein